MTVWFPVSLLGGLVGLDGTSFPQAMISRPLMAGALTGLMFGRPLEGIILGFMVEVFALISLPVGAALYPESGTATVAATSAYMASGAPALDPGYLVLALAFALAWERVTALTVVLQRRGNGRLLVRTSAMAARKLERRHLAAMTMDFLRGAVVCLMGGLIGFQVLRFLGPHWGLAPGATVGLLAVAAAAMVGTVVSLFGGVRSRWRAVASGAGVGLVLAVVLL